MPSTFSKRAGIAMLLGAGLLVSSCATERGDLTQSSLLLDSHFGQSVKQDLAAQVADPDARYAGTPAPGSDGTRVGLAQERYQKGKVLQPAATSVSGGIDSGGGNSGGGSQGSQ